ncbi:MAG: ORF6N domain-containing protein [Bacteroidetes bacterium]|nr:ORF6N domain-containing protein [Bacteroidota bacterium]
MKNTDALIPIEKITSKICLMRDEKVLLDSDLAELYGVETKQLKRSVRRNFDRFPKDFMFQLSREEYDSLRSQFGTLKRGEHTKYLPYVFTEQGVAMLSSVLNNERAVKVNIAIMRAFVQMRKFLQSSEALAKKLNELERETKKKFADQHKQIKIIFDAIKQLMTEKNKPKKQMGFVVKEK